LCNLLGVVGLGSVCGPVTVVDVLSPFLGGRKRTKLVHTVFRMAVVFVMYERGERERERERESALEIGNCQNIKPQDRSPLPQNGQRTQRANFTLRVEYIPQVQVVIACQVIMQFDAVLESLHCRVSETHRRVILLAEL
jgi:hypothetical protein